MNEDEVLTDTVPATDVTDEANDETVATQEHDSKDAQATTSAATTTDRKSTPASPEPVKPKTQVKLIALNDIVSGVREAVWQIFERVNSGVPEDERQYPGRIQVYDTFAVVCIGLQYWRFNYTFEGGIASITPRSEWEMVEQEWVTKMFTDSTVVYPGDAVKAIDEDGVIGGWLVRFTSENSPDFHGDFFDSDTDYGPHKTSLVFFNHALDPVMGHKALGIKNSGRWAEATLKQTDAGVWIQTQLDMRDQYERAIYHLAKQGKLGWSSGTAKHLVKRSLVSGKAYHVDVWPLGVDASITPSPAAGPDATAVVTMKTYQQRISTSLKSLMSGLEIPENKPAPVPGILEELNMTPEELKQMLGEVVDEKLQPITTQVGDNKKSLDALKNTPATNKLPIGGDDGGENNESGVFAKSFFVQQFGEPDAAMKQVMTDLIGPNFEQTLYDINQVFRKWVLGGERRLNAKEMDLLSRQRFSPTDLKAFMIEGFTVAEIKARMDRAQNLLQGVPLPPSVQDRFAKAMGRKDTMVSTDGTLGGYAITPMREDIVSRLPGNTVIRSGGARVVDLINSTSVDIPVYSGGDDRYRGAMRGAWGGEKVTSPPTNATLEMVSVQAHPYTFYVPMTRTMLMNAGNVVQLLTDDIIDTAAIDEDEAFIRGEGTGGKPLGIIPGGAYDSSLGIGLVQHTAVTADKLIELSDDLDDQYTDMAIFVFKKSTGTVIRQLKDANNNYLLRVGIDSGQPGTLLGHVYRRTQAMPAVAVGSAPVLFGDMRGYLIVQEPGLTIERFQDSNTGLGQVQFHVWRMLGGRIEKPWMMSVLEITS